MNDIFYGDPKFHERDEGKGRGRGVVCCSKQCFELCLPTSLKRDRDKLHCSLSLSRLSLLPAPPIKYYTLTLSPQLRLHN